MKNKISPTFCVLPWIHLSSHTGGKIRTCSVGNTSPVKDPTNTDIDDTQFLKNNDNVPANFSNTSLEEAWNSNYMKNVRKTMLLGKRPSSCTCYSEEDGGHLSKRIWEFEYWSKKYNIEELINQTNEDGSIPVNIKYVDIRLGSKCQLSCVMCSPNESSGWVKEWKKLYPKIQNPELKNARSWDNKGKSNNSNYNWHKNNPKFWNELMNQIPNIEQLSFAGGESLIIKEHYDLLEECIKKGNAKNIELRYISNGVEWRSDLFDLWNEFKKVKFNLSIDSYGEKNDYIRYPSNWNNQEEVFWKLDNTSKKVQISIGSAMMALNIAYLPEFVQWKVNQGFKKINSWPHSGGGINTHLVYWPPQLNMKVLPINIKQKITEKYENEFYPWIEENWDKFTGIKENNVKKEEFLNHSWGLSRYKSLINFMNSEDLSSKLPETIEYLKLLNSQRNWNDKFLKVFPIFEEILN